MKVESYTYTEGEGWSGELGANDSDRTLVTVFGAFDYHARPERFAEIARAYPRSEIVGCSTSGEFTSGGFRTGTISLMAMQFERADVAVAQLEVSPGEDSYDVGARLANTLAERGDLTGALVLSNSTCTHGSRLLEGVNAHVPEGACVFGGVASAFASFERMWTLAGEEVGMSHVVAAGFYGPDVTLRNGTRSGWEPLGVRRRITRSDGPHIHEFDGKPALDLYEKYLGEHAEGLPRTGLFFPLELETDAGATFIRAVVDIDAQERSITVLADAPQGSRARLMKWNPERLLEAAEDAAESAGPARSGEAGCIVVSCVGRRIVLGERVDEEYEALREVLPEGLDIAGFYSHGEYAPESAGAACDHHNQTISVTVITEAGS
jgi:hypothetical protein